MKIKYQDLSIRRTEDIITDFNLTIESGKLCVIVGPSGCGKSTLLETTAGLLPVESGKIYFGNNDITGLNPEARQIGYVF